jgi:L-seryl-tRNA(Ser) seleniumtransferase
MITTPPDMIRARAQRWLDTLPAGAGELSPGESTVGGGSLPGETLRTTLLALTVSSPQRFLKKLRQSSPPIIARVEHDRVVLDPRTVLEEQDETLFLAVKSILK